MKKIKQVSKWLNNNSNTSYTQIDLYTKNVPNMVLIIFH